MGDAARVVGALVGAALGDALGVPSEGLDGRRVEALGWHRTDRFHLPGGVGWVSDDTEQSALLIEAIARAPNDVGAAVSGFRRALLGWFARLPWGVGLATARACLRIALGLRVSGVVSAGNGAAMRAAALGALFAEDPVRRRAFGRALAEVTHRDPRAVDGALYAAEVAAALATGCRPDAAVDAGIALVESEELAVALRAARDFPRDAPPAAAAARLGNSGFVVHTLGLSTWALLAGAGDFSAVLGRVLAAGGDTDSVGAIAGAWCGAAAPESLPPGLVERLAAGPFGAARLAALGEAAASRAAGEAAVLPAWSGAVAMRQNLGRWPIVIAWGLWARVAPR